MKKVTKNARIADLESKLVVMQTQINNLIECSHSHTKRLIALEPDNPFHGKFFGREQPKLKQLDQSVFDHPYATDRFKYVALNADGQAVFFESKPVISSCLDIWVVHTGSVMPMLNGYDATNWQNSLIERDKVELTGSDLAKAMLERGDKWVLCFIGDTSEPATIARGSARIVIGIRKDRFETDNTAWKVAIPINSQGEPLTQSDVGL